MMTHWDWLLHNPEGQFLERKSCYDRSGDRVRRRDVRSVARDIAETPSAMASAAGGTVVAGNLDALNTYAAEKGLRQNELFWAVAQAMLEMAEPQSHERTLLEALVAWGRGKAPEEEAGQERLL